MAKQLNTRIQHKYDTAENWDKATEFVPLSGELIIYAPDADNPYCRIKIGDGQTTVNNLAFEEGAIPKHTYGETTKTEGSASSDPEGSVYFVYKK